MRSASVLVICGVAQSFQDYAQWSGALTRALYHLEQPNDPDVLEWMEQTMEVVEAQAMACWSHGGRYWETNLRSTAYFQSLRIDFEADDCGGCLDQIRQRIQQLPEQLIGGLCAPRAWEVDEVRSKALPAFLAHSLQFDFQLPAPQLEQLEVQELSHWSQLLLHFVVGGLDSCGTNTLTRGLEQVDEIVFTMEDEDPFFFRHDALLPYRQEVDDFNFRWLRTAGVGAANQLLGLRHPGLFHSHRVRMALARVPRLKMILVLCDPLSRFEKRFWLQNQCQVNVHAIPSDSRCFWSPKAALEEPWLLRSVSFAGHLEQLQRLLGVERLRAVHQASFRQSFVEVFQQLADFLGLQRKPLKFTAQRHNHHGGHRSDLCHNASLVSDLQALLSAEYRAVEELLQSRGGGVALPEELILRRTRCDRPEELAERSVPAVPLEILVPTT